MIAIMQNTLSDQVTCLH